MPNYTEIPESFRLSYSTKFDNIDRDQIPALAEEDPVIFAYCFLGKKLRLHQAFIMQRILDARAKGRNRVAMCLGRQLGKSINLGIFLIWASWFNKFPSSISKTTSIFIISRDDPASMELLDKIRGILHDGNKQMKQFTDMDDFFTGSLKEPNNQHQITFLNGCFIKSLPPTGQVLGKSASLIVVDEAHRLECQDPDKFFNQFVVPTVAETGGMIILSSSPEGMTGFFHEAIDPDGEKEDNPYESIWFSHSVWDDGSDECIRYQSFVETERKNLSSQGRIREFQQEYESLFTVTQSSFFENADIDNAIEDTPQHYKWKETPCSVGYDYGISKSRTAITIRTKMNDKIVQLFQFQSPAGFDNNLLIDPKFEHSIQRFKERYNLSIIVVDDSPPGDTTNRWLENNSGIPVKKYNFRSDQMSKTDGVNRNSLAYSYKAALKLGQLKIPKWNTIQIAEMRTIQEEMQKVLISIKAPQGSLCDTFDSDMMACLPFLDMSMQYSYEFDSNSLELAEDPYNPNPRLDRSGFKRMTDEECKELIRQANENLL